MSRTRSAVLAAVAAAATTTPTEWNPPRKIAIVGAGVVGLATALRLQLDGHQVMKYMYVCICVSAYAYDGVRLTPLPGLVSWMFEATKTIDQWRAILKSSNRIG